MIKKVGLNLIALTILFRLFSANQAVADQYGGAAPPTSVVVDKTVCRPYTGKGGVVACNYVDNLSPSDPRFAPGAEIRFNVRIKNVAQEEQSNVVVNDFVPTSLGIIEVPGSFDASTRILKFDAGHFNIDEEKNYTLRMRVLPQGQLPADKGLYCEVNKVRATGNQTADEDTAQYCIEKTVTPGKKVPSAGPEMGILLLGGELTTLGLGLLLKRKSA